MLILYDKSEKDFLSNGIAILDKYAFDDEVFEELNGMFKLEFTYPMFAPHAKELKFDNIVRATTPDSEQPFFITKLNNVDGYLKVTAYHIFYKLIKELIEDIYIVNLSGQMALKRILEGTEFNGTSTINKTNSIRIVRYNPVEAILNTGKDNTFLSRFGGEIKRDRFNVAINQRIGRTYESNPVEIRYAKNLEGYEVDIDSTGVANRVMPQGFNGLLLPEKYVIKDGTNPDEYKTVKEEYPHIKAIEDPDDPKEDELPLEEAYQALRDAVQADFESGKFDVKANYKIVHQELSKTEEYKNKSVLERIYIGDEIRVIHEDEDIDIVARVISYRWRPTIKEYKEIELGNYQKKFSNIREVIDSVNEKIDENKDLTAKEIEYVTKLLTSALGGHVLKQSGELFIMDTDDPNTATKVWRWNLNGLGYSGTGVNGPYETAITMDGHIVGKFIQTIELAAISADLGTVIAGRIQDADNESYWDLDSKEIVLNVKSLQIKGENVVQENTYNNEKPTYGPSAPPSPAIGKLWVDTSVTPNLLKRWTGSKWEIVNDTSALVTRVEEAESKVTPQAIVDKVSEATNQDNEPLFAKTAEVKLTVDTWTARFSQIGGRNLLRKSKVSLSNNSYPTGTFYMVDPMEEGETYTITVWGSLGASKENFALYLNGGSLRLTYLEEIKAGMYQATFKGVSGGVEDFVNVYPMPQSITSVSNITHVQLEKGSVGTDWSPAPEEFYEGIVKIDLDGIEVGVSNSTIKTLFQHDGMRIVDITTGNDIAKFTADGANIDELTVKKVRSPHVVNKIGTSRNYYVYSVATGDGSGRDEFNRASSVQDALKSALDDAIVIENNAQININISGAINEDISINGISGHGRINILGAYGSTRVTGRLFVNNSTCPVYCEGVTFISVETSSGLIYANGLSNVNLNHIRIDGANNSVGVRARNGAIIRIEDSPVVNCTTAYFADYMSQIFAFDTYGQGNAIVAGARQMGKVGMYYRRPEGTTLSQIYDGGIVDDSATQTLSSFSYTPPAWSTISKTFVAELETANASSGYVWRTGTWTQGSWDGQAHKGTADFGTRIKDFLEGSGGFQNISNVIIKARRNESSGRSNPVSLKVTSPTSLTLPAVTLGASSQANANATIISAMQSGALKLQSSTTSSSDYAGFDRIEITFSVQKKV